MSNSALQAPNSGSLAEPAPYQTLVCLICGWVYDEAKGAPEDGIAPGTRWADVPPDWSCPECGAGKSDFDMAPI